MPHVRRKGYWQFQEMEIVIEESGQTAVESQGEAGSEFFVILFSRCVPNAWDRTWYIVNTWNIH